MKLRLRHNTLRLRLTQSEVRRLVTEGELKEELWFGPATAFTYRLLSNADATSVGATFADGNVTVTLPAAQCRAWAESSEVGIEAVQPARLGEELRILIEKDFQCLTAPSDEDQSDAFPNPEKAC